MNRGLRLNDEGFDIDRIYSFLESSAISRQVCRSCVSFQLTISIDRQTAVYQ
jgi:hypothetical protein